MEAGSKVASSAHAASNAIRWSAIPRRCFARRFRVVVDLINEEEPALGDEVVETLGPRLEQLEHGKEPGVPLPKVGVVP